MKYKSSHFFLIRWLDKLLKANPELTILDLGSGLSRPLRSLFEKYPHLNYIGLEPEKGLAHMAKAELSRYPNVKIIEAPADDRFVSLGQFDVVLSLSVLEHVKDLKNFLEFSVEHLKKDGQLVHIYDLGHYYYPSWGSTLLLRICRWPFFRALIPHPYFMVYVDQKEVEGLLTQAGAKIIDITYHNSPVSGSFIKELLEIKKNPVLIERLIDLEVVLGNLVKDISTRPREKTFPTIAIWAQKL